MLFLLGLLYLPFLVNKDFQQRSIGLLIPHNSCITWKLSCGHVCKMFGRQWPNEPKIAIFYDPSLIWGPLSSEPPSEFGDMRSSIGEPNSKPLICRINALETDECNVTGACHSHLLLIVEAAMLAMTRDEVHSPRSVECYVTDRERLFRLWVRRYDEYFVNSSHPAVYIPHMPATSVSVPV